jgi:hypothetical protein
VAADAEYLGAIQNRDLPELSGLVASHRQRGLYWGLNDSGNPPRLLALEPGRRIVANVAVGDGSNLDWEDLAAFEQDGQPWLLIADTGDNFSLRREAVLLLLPEPSPDASHATPARHIRFHYEDGPRDCEAVAVDLPARRILLADKGRHPASLYELPLDAPETGAVARRIAEIPPLVPNTSAVVQPLSARWRGQITAMDLSPDGLSLLLLTDQTLTLFRRLPEQDWAQALRHPAGQLRLPPFPNFESVAFSQDLRAAIFGNEGPISRFYRWRLPPR